MYYELIKFPLRHEALNWEAREALLDIEGRPHLFLRIKLTGTGFPVVAQIPEVWVGDVFARKVMIDEDGRTVRAYFEKPLPKRGDLYFGHLGRAELHFGRFEPRRVVRLDRERLSADVVLRV
ncbi:MAG TPA: hypothetical protein VES62_07660 [Thermoleophilaceae bacterium]|nr:hypothetical protein [Thermoleophilaceae bacterium]